jgi:hypothetical protein
MSELSHNPMTDLSVRERIGPIFQAKRNVSDLKWVVQIVNRYVDTELTKLSSFWTIATAVASFVSYTYLVAAEMSMLRCSHCFTESV